MLYTGWTFEQVGGLTMPQMRAVVAAVNRRREEQIKMWGGTTKGSEKEIDGTIAIEQRLQMLRAQTGKTKFDLREVI